MKVFVRDLSRKWRTEGVSDFLTVVHPLNDRIVHDLPREDCICGPATEMIEGTLMPTHHSLDGRENSEGPIFAAMERGEKVVIVSPVTAKVACALGGAALVGFLRWIA